MLLMRKYDEENSACLLSHPVRGAWIEIDDDLLYSYNDMSHPVRGAWIEILTKTVSLFRVQKSHPVRGAWIEIVQRCY